MGSRNFFFVRFFFLDPPIFVAFLECPRCGTGSVFQFGGIFTRNAHDEVKIIVVEGLLQFTDLMVRSGMGTESPTQFIKLCAYTSQQFTIRVFHPSSPPTRTEMAVAISGNARAKLARSSSPVASHTSFNATVSGRMKYD